MGRPKGIVQRVLRRTKLLNTRKNLFFSNVIIPQEEDGCMIWKSSKRNGYGRFIVNKKIVNAHRYSYEYFIGKIPQGMILMHKCDNPPCVRPDHLELGTYEDNARDRVSKHRHKVMNGELNGMAKLTEKDVKEIKRKLEKGYFCEDLANEYGVHISTISKINVGKYWRHV
jgi:uncharacterized protein YcgL (UPF0745 family)